MHGPRNPQRSNNLPPMVDALVDVLTNAHSVEEKDINYDKFTTAVSE